MLSSFFMKFKFFFFPLLPKSILVLEKYKEYTHTAQMSLSKYQTEKKLLSLFMHSRVSILSSSKREKNSIYRQTSTFFQLISIILSHLNPEWSLCEYVCSPPWKSTMRKTH